ncbi:RagB/SusD family nutrient uptake outer membrane protein [Neptunitalea lumnitzerae]|uniref:Membrane protein n=1 Tax=Neptunitalea lumnitzerae TaxID=2965509 RepID=A0ABQ5ME80_9FLAO|nr:RagB/SusD family nutrient uptake outer membrane protein [Neptunitalea sp. Y10]GLB47686.1 membrane protein [Neptunitalea sp. Y10]
MKKYNVLTIWALMAMLFVTFSCTDDFVDRKAEYSIDSENYFNSEDDYYNALIAVYDILQSTYVNVLLGEIASDNTLCGGESATDVIGFQQVDDMTHTPINDNLTNVWDWNFAGVNRANYILEFKDKTEFEGKEQIIAETRFLRAYFYFELVKWFGALPLKDDARFAINDEKSIPRSPVEEVYAYIEADLQYAVENLSVTAPQVGRASKGAAQALLGKVYLYQEKFSESAAVLEDLISSSNYALVNDFSTLFEEEQENGIESVFEVQYTDIEGAGFGCLQCSEGNVAVGFMGIRNYEGPMFSSGFSFNLPTPDAYAAFDDDDMRRDYTVLDVEAWAAETGATYGTGYEHTGYFNRKYLPRKRSADAQSDLNLTNPNNYRAIRYADVLLMAAEAYNRGGINDTKAQEYLNEVRARAYGDTNHNITVSGNALTDYIWEERRLELMGEGHRFFDLVRTGRAAQNIPGFTAGKNEVFPVPFEEIQFSNGNWEQNPNY